MLQIDEDQCDKKFIKLRLTIEDTGCGISKEGQQNLFTDFNTLAENEQRNKEGTGLGLSICKNIIE